MAGKCIHHPGRDATIEVGGKKYCAKCEQGQKNAAKLVDRHVEPKDCFVWYLGGDNWTAITGTGCAHWIAHKQGITHGTPMHRCLKGFTLKVADITKGKKEVTSIDQVKQGDIYVNPAKTHAGIVSKVLKITGKPPKINIEIEHDSSRQGKVAKNDFATYFKGKGKFYR